MTLEELLEQITLQGKVRIVLTDDSPPYGNDTEVYAGLAEEIKHRPHAKWFATWPIRYIWLGSHNDYMTIEIEKER